MIFITYTLLRYVSKPHMCLFTIIYHKVSMKKKKNYNTDALVDTCLHVDTLYCLLCDLQSSSFIYTLFNPSLFIIFIFVNNFVLLTYVQLFLFFFIVLHKEKHSHEHLFKLSIHWIHFNLKVLRLVYLLCTVFLLKYFL